MKKLLLLSFLLLSLLLSVGCFNNTNTDDPNNPHSGHTDIVWTVDSNLATCNRQYEDETFTVTEFCRECNGIVNNYCIPCTEFLVHQPDENGYCAVCRGYDKNFNAPTTVSWEENGALHTVRRGNGVLAHIKQTDDETLETYYTYEAEGIYYLVYTDEITVKVYRNGRIADFYTLTRSENPDEFSVLEDELNEVYAHTVPYTGEFLERTASNTYEVSYNFHGEAIEFSLPYYTYSCYTANDEGERGELIASNVSSFNHELLSFTSEVEGASLTYEFIKDASPVSVPEKPEDAFYLALAKLEDVGFFYEEEYRMDIVTTEYADNGESGSITQVVLSDRNALMCRNEFDGSTYYITERDDGVYLTAYLDGAVVYDGKQEGFIGIDMQQAFTLHGLYLDITRRLEAQEPVFENGVATFADRDDEKGYNGYVHVYVENERIVRVETVAFQEENGENRQLGTNDVRISYEEVDVVVPEI